MVDTIRKSVVHLQSGVHFYGSDMLLNGISHFNNLEKSSEAETKFMAAF